MKPVFIESNVGKLFAIYQPSMNANSFGKAIIHIPAFAEEMNRSRRIVALQAQAFCNDGYTVLVLDLFGTGDSNGDFGEATWEIWLQNIDTAIDWLKQKGMHSIALWGLRTGALLAMDFVNHRQNQIQGLIAWQPVLNGDAFVTQFLRLRVAAAIINSNAPPEKTSNLKQQLLEGHAIEVAGYLLNPDLIKSLMALHAEKLNLQSIKHVAIFDIVSQESFSPVSHSLISTVLQEQGIDISLTKIMSDAFWSNQGNSDVSNLIKMTCENLKKWF
jgi:exosortase A-associated hydrolase 2